jgi:UDP-3-O-[3-hydroxymyristoyl] glucosamine N-acyltransferase
LITLHKIAEIVGGKVIGAPDLNIVGVSDIKEGAPNTITFLFNPKQKALLDNTTASAVVVSEAKLLDGKNGIEVENPRLAMATILGLFEEKSEVKGIHSTAIISESAKLGNNVQVGAYAVIGEHATVSNNVTIHNHSSIGNNVVIDEGTELQSHVSIYDGVKIGKNVLIDMGTVIGSCGFGFETVDGVHHKIPQIGSVVIGDNVDIGANCTIDRGTIRNTIIGAGTKIDNMVQVAHNVNIGIGCLIAGQTGISGSVTIGDYCMFGGHVGVADGVTIGDKAIFLGKTGVTKSVEGGKIYSGNPCREIREANKRNAAYTEIQFIKKRLKALENKIAE